MAIYHSELIFLFLSVFSILAAGLKMGMKHIWFEIGSGYGELGSSSPPSPYQKHQGLPPPPLPPSPGLENTAAKRNAHEHKI